VRSYARIGGLAGRRSADRYSAVQRLCRPGEGGQESVASDLDLAATKPLQLRPHRLEVSGKELSPVPPWAGELWPAGNRDLERLVGYISPVETLRMLPSGSLNQTAFSESPTEATPSFHSMPSISNVWKATPFSLSAATSASNAEAGASKLAAVALLVPAYLDS